MKEEESFQPVGQPLPTDYLDRKAQITLADVQKAIKESQGKIKSFLQATTPK